jgi:transcriptional regulator with XRE-family HTH domain
MTAKKIRSEPYAEEGRRLRLLRQAEGYPVAYAFAQKLGWPHSALSQFEAGKTRMQISRALDLRRLVPGLDLTWLYTGDARGLPYDLRKRIEAEEAKEDALAGSHGLKKA